MKIRWHGHSCFEISNGQTVVTDPHDGKSIGIPTPRAKADVILVSHSHFDHNSVRTVKGTNSRVYDKPGSYADGKMDLLGVTSFHDEAQGQKRGEVIIYKFKMDDIRICHLGDLGCVIGDDVVRQLGEVDILFVPVGNIFTIDGPRAWQVIDAIDPLVAIPMHYRVGGLSLSIKTIDPFLAEAKGKASIVNVGNEIEFDRIDLPEKLAVWVFSL